MALPDEEAGAGYPAYGAGKEYQAKAKGTGDEHRTSKYRIESRAGECEPLRDDGHAEQERKGTGMAQQPKSRLDRGEQGGAIGLIGGRWHRDARCKHGTDEEDCPHGRRGGRGPETAENARGHQRAECLAATDNQVGPGHSLQRVRPVRQVIRQVHATDQPHGVGHAVGASGENQDGRSRPVHTRGDRQCK